MNEKIVKEKTCAVTGHREINGKINENKLIENFAALTEQGYDTFLVGMAIGFDTLCFHALEKIRKNKEIKIIACVPCETQDYKFSLSQKKEYGRMIAASDDVIYVSREYTPKCMFLRNMFMVDNCSVLFAFLRKQTGGTANTVNYALRKGVQVLYL